MYWLKRVVSTGALVAVAASMSGCVVRPLWWGDHGEHARERSGSSSERSHRDDGRREEWRQPRQ